MPLSLPTLFQRFTPLAVALSLAALAPVQALSLPGITDAVSGLFDSAHALSASPQGFLPQAFPLADGPVHEEWNRRWDDPSHASDIAAKVAVDKDGNVYVAGYSDANYSAGTGPDYRLVKYAPDGTELWNRSYDGPGHSLDQLAGLALDAEGDAYVTGTSLGIVTGRTNENYRDAFDYATVKYAPNGDLLWTRRYEGPIHGYDSASAIAVDKDGNAYVTGTSQGNGVYDYATIKYAPDGSTLWTSRYSAPHHQYSQANAIAVDAQGNSYVTGHADFDNTTDIGVADCTTIKYSPDGVALWVRSPAASQNDQGNAIAVDADGGVSVAGFAEGNETSYLTLKYDADGHELWRALHGNSRGYAFALALAVDDAGNTLVTGNDGTIKYRPDGSQRWLRDDLGADSTALAVDAAGCIYVAGYSPHDDYLSNVHRDFSLIKYGPDGRLHWSRSFDGPTHELDEANALALDDGGNVYVTGISGGGEFSGIAISHTDMRTIKYSQ